MDLQNFYSKEIPGPDNFNEIESDIEAAIGRVVGDVGPGTAVILAGLVASQQGSPNLTVHLSAGVAYDGQTPRRRIAVPADVAAVDLSVDSGGVPTAPASGMFCYVSLAVVFARANSDQRTVDDGSGAGTTTQIYYRQLEGYAILVVKGADAGSSGAAAMPALPTGAVPIADYIIGSGTTAITDAMRNVSRRVPGFSTERSKAPAAALDQIGGATYDNLQVIPATPYALSVSVKPGRYNTGAQAFTLASPTAVALAAPGSNSYYALIYADDSGAIGVAYGAASGSPAKPSLGAGLPLAYVLIHSTDTFVTESAITDIRPFLGGRTGLYRNRFYIASAAGTEHLLNLGFAYATGTHALDVFVDGVKIPEVDGYAETSSTSITLVSSPSSGVDVEVYAYEPAAQAVAPAHAPTHAPGGSDPIDYSLVFAPLNGKVIGDCLIATNEPYDNQTPTAINVGPVAVVLGGLPLSNPASTALTAANLEAGGSFTAFAWLYIYAYRNPDHTASQQLLFTLSTVAPDAANKFKSTDSTRLYMGAVSISARATIRPFHRRGRRTIYHGTEFLDAGNTNAFNNPIGIKTVAVVSSTINYWMDCSQLVPPTANNTMVGVLNESTTSGVEIGSLNVPVPGFLLYNYLNMTIDTNALMRGEVPGSGQKIAMITSDFANVYLGIYGYDD